MWSRRSVLKAGVRSGGIVFLGSYLGEHLTAIPQTGVGGERSRDLTALTIRDAGELVRRKAVSPVELTRACLQRIDRLNPALNAFVTVTADVAMAQAREAWRWRTLMSKHPIGTQGDPTLSSGATT